MSARHSTPPTAPCKVQKPAKPNLQFLLFAHANGSWAKKIRGELHYFGGWGDPEAALEAYNRVKEDLHAGRKPREVSKTGVVRALCNDFWNAKNALVEAGELSPRTMQDYSRTTDLISEEFGKNRSVETSALTTSPICGRPWPRSGGRTCSARLSSVYARCSSMLTTPV